MKKVMFLIAGLFSGILLGLMLKAVQSFSGHKVYRLLLNADYVPVLKEFRLSEFTEFVIHLVISAVLVVVLGIFWQYLSYRPNQSAYTARKVIAGTALISMVIGAALYPRTLLSSGGTPPINSVPAWFWWLFAHSMYGAISGVLIYWIQGKRNKEKG
ncbi:hypothetical protein [Saccharibacillus sp. JS10]|uniref:hypothetical protein n=1 Tax=Saccharibacillus sp. JS10 TaxID=2950552 RepID=UPI00210D65D9|nr:hypothetical protein [Saccharibacillus sp. JS10]MCQ4086453.1 hypothetical protein [Saccharibacillus sp. JS10]